MKKYELTKKGKIIIAIAAILLIGLIVFLVIPKGNNVDAISIEMVSPNEGFVVDDPVLGMSTNLKVGKKIKLSNTIHPEKHKKVNTKYVSTNEEVAYVNEDNMIVGKSEGTTKVYMITEDNKIKSNTIEITVVK